MTIAALAATALAGTTKPARAEWLKASSRHFIVYADSDEKTLRRQATELERFDAVLRRYPYVTPDTDAAFNPLTVYVLPDTEAVQKMMGGGNVAGFYLPRVTGSIAFTPRDGDGDDSAALTPRVVLFHEYAHHFMFGQSARAFPAWYSEGYAEFASTVMQRGDDVWLGAPAKHRGFGLFAGKELTLRQLLAPPSKMTGEKQDGLYGRGWLLTHYLMFQRGGPAKLQRYLQLFDAGTPSLEAATEAFGDLRALDRELDQYLERRSAPALKIDAVKLGVPVIDIRPLTPGERALIRLRMESTRGTNDKTAPALFALARVAAAPFPNDAVAQGWLAEIAYDADDLAAAAAAADAALAVDAKSSQALLYKARVLLARAAADKADAKRWAGARSWIVRANRVNVNDAGALALYYESFAMEGVPASPAAIAGLYRAVELAPQDRSLRFTAAVRLLLDGDPPAAKGLLRSLASDPHAGADNAAGRLLALLDAGQTGRAALDALAAAQQAEKAKDGK